MASRIAIVGLAILVSGTMIGMVGVATPAASTSQQPVALVKTEVILDPNDYATQSLVMTSGKTVQIGLSIDNRTIFTFDVMNQTQYDVWYNCAPRCHQPLLGGNGKYYQQANEVTPTQVNVTVSPASPFTASFTAPSNATYYFVLDNSVGPTWADYLNQNATGSTMGQLTLTSSQAVTDFAVNWEFVGLGSAAILVGGAIATWLPHPKLKSSEEAEKLRAIQNR